MGNKKIRSLQFAALSALVLSGCAFVQNYEESLRINCLYGDELYYSIDVSIFNNAIMPGIASAEIPEGFSFLGWAYTGWEFGKDSIDDLYKANAILHYSEAKPFAKNGVTDLHAIVVDNEDLPERYFVLGWYAKSSTSGLDQDIMDTFTPALMDFLSSKGASDEDLKNVAIRGYSGDVATMGASINSDGDVDVLLGVGNNINSTAGVEIIEKAGDIMCGGKSRYIARLTEKEVSVWVYEWLKTPEAQSYLVAK